MDTPTETKFSQAHRLMHEHFGNAHPGTCNPGDLSFLNFTAVCFSAVQAGFTSTLLGNLVRCKDEHLELFHERLVTHPGTSTFLHEARVGVEFIMRQQLSQS